MQLRIPLNSGDMQPKDAKVTIRGRGELLLNYVPPLLWLMCRNNPKRGGTDRHEIHETARYRHCSPRPHCRASVSGSGCLRREHSDSPVLSSLAAVRLQTAVAVDAALRT